jgi:type II secretory ATPase GspE/PulE/Tfp pilus assembly ATPase PilB-like protein
VLPVEGRVRSLLGASTEEIVAAAVAQGMTTVRQDGVRLCLAGVTSVEEVLRVVGA